MAARLARAKATVVTPSHGELQHVSLVVRANVATVRLGADVLIEQPAVARVVPTARRTWELHFEGGEVWTVTDERRKCCGGR